MKANSLERYLWAFIIIAIGGVMLANSLDLLNIHIWYYLARLWPLFIVIPGITALARGKIFIGMLMIVAGGSFLLGNFTDIDTWQFIWPIVIIVFGVSLLFRDRWGTISKSTDSREDYLDETVIFGGLEKKFVSQNFKGGKVDTVFGGAEIDLREIKLAGERVKLEINAIFGGTEIRVNPEHYRVVANGTGVFGAWTSKFEQKAGNKPTLEFTGAAVFGGVEIKE